MTLFDVVVENPNLSDHDQERNNTSRVSDFIQFLVDVAEFRKRAQERALPFVDNVFSDRAALSQLPGMSWIAGVETILFAPTSSDVAAQRAQLTTFFHTLKSESILLPQAFMPGLPEGYHEPLLALDIETTGLDTRLRYDREGKLITNTHLVGVSIATSDTRGYYLPIRHVCTDGVPNWDNEVIVEFLNTLVESFTIIFHNAMYDREILAINGVTKLRPFPYFFDTMILDYLYDVNHKSHGLKHASERHLGRKMIELEQLFNNSKEPIEFQKLSSTAAHIYGASDSINTYALFKFFASQLGEQNVFTYQSTPLQIDHKALDTARDMTRPGLPINFRYFYYAAKDAIYRLMKIEQAIYREAGQKFDINSPKQLSKVLFDDFKIPPLPSMEKGANGVYSLKEEVLDALFATYPDFAILRYVVIYRKLQASIGKIYLKALANSWVDAYLPWTRVQLSFSLTNVPTGRFSSSSGDGKERVTVKQSDKTKKLSYTYTRGSWDCGFNSQGIPNPFFKTAPARRIKALPPEAGLDLNSLYPESVEEAFIKGLAGL